ncbi:hypothetical protein BN903_38 [Halorubrum sp. AJ67]|nr:hypothetical protein BN903_38 [Halorubrum sp. AJ67]
MGPRQVDDLARDAGRVRPARRVPRLRLRRRAFLTPVAPNGIV